MTQPTDYILRYLAECRLIEDFSALGQRNITLGPRKLQKKDIKLMESIVRDIAIIKHVYVRDYL